MDIPELVLSSLCVCVVGGGEGNGILVGNSRGKWEEEGGSLSLLDKFRFDVYI